MFLLLLSLSNYGIFCYMYGILKGLRLYCALMKRYGTLKVEILFISPPLFCKWFTVSNAKLRRFREVKFTSSKKSELLESLQSQTYTRSWSLYLYMPVSGTQLNWGESCQVREQQGVRHFTVESSHDKRLWLILWTLGY